MKVSEITLNNVTNYLKLEDLTSSEEEEISTLITVAKTFIKSYTGISDLDLHDDFVIVVYILVQDMYDNRTMYVDKGNINQVVETILNMHSTNLL